MSQNVKKFSDRHHKTHFVVHSGQNTFHIIKQITIAVNSYSTQLSSTRDYTKLLQVTKWVIILMQGVQQLTSMGGKTLAHFILCMMHFVPK